MRTKRNGALLAALFLVACESDDSTPDALDLPDTDIPDVTVDVDRPDGTEDDPPIEIRVDGVVPNPANSLSYYVIWETDVAVQTDLNVVCGDDYDQHFVDTEATTSHEVFVMGLWEGADCELTIRAAADGHLTTTATTDITDAGPLPDELPELDVQVVDAARMQPGWTMWSVTGAESSENRINVAIDPEGRYRWYHAPGSNERGAGNEIILLDDGNILFGAAEPQQIVSWEGTVLYDLPQSAHHDMSPAPWAENHMLTLSSSSANCENAQHTAIEVDMETNEVVWEWHTCEHYNPRHTVGNWTHLNTIEPFPNERAVLISSRDQDTIFRVNRDTDEVEWVLGVGGDFELAEEDRFFRQHAPHFLPNGDILLLDNGVTAAELRYTTDPEEWARPYTRAVQYTLEFHEDGTPDRAYVSWEYSDESIFAVNRSEADRLDNGNTLIHYVWVGEDLRVRMREVTMEGDIVWDVLTPSDVASYRSERVPEYFGHVR